IQMHDMSPDVLMQMLKTLLKEEFKQFIQNLNLGVSDEYLSRKEAAEFLKISETTLWSLDKSQELPARRLRGKVLYLKSDLLNFSKQSA
ncbi:MAG: helix-turn-helix domain-containing protein, partial [Polaribacter sp.]